MDRSGPSESFGVAFAPPIGVAFGVRFGVPFGVRFGRRFRARFGLPFGPPIGLNLGSFLGSILGPPESANFEFGPPAICNYEAKRSENKKILKKGVLGGARFGLQKGPPRRSDLGSYLGSSLGPRSRSNSDPSGVHFGPPKVASRSGPEKLPKRYIYNDFGRFRTLKKGSNWTLPRGPIWPRGGAQK